MVPSSHIDTAGDGPLPSGGSDGAAGADAGADRMASPDAGAGASRAASPRQPVCGCGCVGVYRYIGVDVSMHGMPWRHAVSAVAQWLVTAAATVFMMMYMNGDGYRPWC